MVAKSTAPSSGDSLSAESLSAGSPSAESSSAKPPFLIGDDFAERQHRLRSKQLPAIDRSAFAAAQPFPHAIIDDFLPKDHVEFLSASFPTPEHPVWLDWRTRHPGQYGKQGPGDATNFDLLDAQFRFALMEFNSPAFLDWLADLTGIDKLLPDPYFTGGGMHQILAGGILDVHTDFNFYARLNLYRRLNVLIYLTESWQESYGGELEFWDTAPAAGGRCVKRTAPLFNRAVVFQTDKQSFHGHPREWQAPPQITRRSIALYYYTAQPAPDQRYDERTDFQGLVEKALPGIPD